MKILLLAILLLLPISHADAKEPGPAALCELLWTQPLPPSRFPEDLREIRDLVERGKHGEAAATLETRLADILAQASKVLRSDKTEVTQAREFMDRFVRAKAPILAARGDLLGPTLGVATWAAEVHCRAENQDAAVRYLRGAWRDYGREELRLALFVVFLRFGETTLAGPLAPDDPVGWREKAAAGYYACTAGKSEKGRVFLDQAETLAPDSRIRGAVTVLVEACK